jgi:O-acetyl-ADP-ribose deacetylase (regulator of RNase III)
MTRAMDMTQLRFSLYTPEACREDVAYRFREVPQVAVVSGDILAAEADALIVPINSFGLFESGFPLRVADRFGFHLQETLRQRLPERHHGELLVGQAEVLPSGAERPAHIIAAPIARAAPGDLTTTVNVYLAVRGALLAVRDAPALGIASVACPLLGVEEGKLTPFAASRQIRYGVRAVLREKPRRVQNLSKAVRREKDLKRQESRKKDDVEAANP